MKSLSAYSARLGEVRDLQVLREVLVKYADGDLGGWLAAELDSGLFAACKRLQRDLSAPSHQEPLDQLSAALLGAGTDGLTSKKSRKKAVRKAVRKAAGRADKRLRRAGTSTGRLHAARKAAKRARYAAEAAGGPSKSIAHYERLQDLLGRHHDLAVAAAYLDDLDPPPAFRDPAAELAGRLRTEAEAVRREAIACDP